MQGYLQDIISQLTAHKYRFDKISADVDAMGVEFKAASQELAAGNLPPHRTIEHEDKVKCLYLEFRRLNALNDEHNCGRTTKL